MDALRRSPEGKIINLSSVSHRFGRIDFDDLYRARHYEGLRVYEQSKLANLLFTYELARRIEPSGITVNSANPGRVRTDIGITHATGIYRLLWKWNKPLLIAPEKGAATSVYLASSPEVRGVTGAYFYKMKPCRSSRRSYDEALARSVWERSASLTGI
jgi:NAD(P)-dependent dehydrogenase (short-subunit alcohol dehydrogenase family)